MLLLTSSKVNCDDIAFRLDWIALVQAYLRHNDCAHARQCRDLVYSQVRRALDLVQLIVYDSGSTTGKNTSNLTLLLAKDEMNFVKSLRQFEVSSNRWSIVFDLYTFQYAVEMLNVSLTSTSKEQLQQLCTKTIDHSQDFTDSAYVSLDQRDRVLHFHKLLQEQLEPLLQHIAHPNAVRI